MKSKFDELNQINIKKLKQKILNKTTKSQNLNYHKIHPNK